MTDIIGQINDIIFQLKTVTRKRARSKEDEYKISEREDSLGRRACRKISRQETWANTETTMNDKQESRRAIMIKPPNSPLGNG